ncbi:sensor histidine kinase [Streptosporangiaceae bacterium NEAU-GS5]|nr:sensor histidine kinase [Streptosporangiaceae bacterium NEAU-GS5]
MFDVTLVVLLEAIWVATTFGTIAHGHLRFAFVTGLGMVATGFLMVRRERPILVVAITVAVDLFGQVVHAHPAMSGNVMAVALYSAGRYAPGLVSATAGGLVGLVYSVLPMAIYYDEWKFPPDFNSAGLLEWLIIVGVGGYIRVLDESAERKTRQRAETAVRQERQRIARELHDVVAHHISVINVLVGASRITMTSDPRQAEEALLLAEGTARDAMAEMRALLHVLRADDTDEPSGHATGGASALPELITQAGSAGLPATLEVTGDVVPLPSTVDHAVYRIVQEALTNTRKHAVGATADVRLDYRPDAVEVEVLDDGSGVPSTGAGLGLAGMAERVALCGGSLQTGPCSGGGFRVRARIPLSPAHLETS